MRIYLHPSEARTINKKNQPRAKIVIKANRK
jgi:hypothetical protein